MTHEEMYKLLEFFEAGYTILIYLEGDIRKGKNDLYKVATMEEETEGLICCGTKKGYIYLHETDVDKVYVSKPVDDWYGGDAIIERC